MKFLQFMLIISKINFKVTISVFLSHINFKKFSVHNSEHWTVQWKSETSVNISGWQNFIFCHWSAQWTSLFDNIFDFVTEHFSDKVKVQWILKMTNYDILSLKRSVKYQWISYNGEPSLKSVNLTLLFAQYARKG